MIIKIASMEEITIKPIGVVKNNIEESKFGGWDEVISEIILNKEYKEALDGIDDYSHLTIIFWMDQVKTCKIKHRPQGIGPLVGILACRCPARPNPIGITTVKLLAHQDNSLKVKGLDVINNTPIIDIKPYTPQYDEVKEVEIPDWVNKLEY
jgi:tRNA-Thr(GGU) m(6)t(6)A37 methyltransferase TsaA